MLTNPNRYSYKLFLKDTNDNLLEKLYDIKFDLNSSADTYINLDGSVVNGSFPKKFITLTGKVQGIFDLKHNFYTLHINDKTMNLYLVNFELKKNYWSAVFQIAD